VAGIVYTARVTRYDVISIWEMVMGNRTDMVTYHIDVVILDIDMGYGLMIWEMKVSIRSSPISMWDILSLWTQPCHSCDVTRGIVELEQQHALLLGGGARRVVVVARDPHAVD
jgi:hypothetical protein